MKIDILYEDENILAVNKPSGVIVHPDGHDKSESLMDWSLSKYPKMKGVGEKMTLSTGERIERPGIVHRLDRETSGVILIAKTFDGFDCLKAQFKDRTIRKTYHAFVWGEIKREHGTIDRPIGRSRSDFRLWSAQRGARGEMRDAVTSYEVLKRCNGFSFVEVEPKTGRTHQIRIHFKAINYPLVADMAYAPGKGKALGFERVALHSRKIQFLNTEGEKIVVEAPYPEDFQKALADFDSVC